MEDTPIHQSLDIVTKNTTIATKPQQVRAMQWRKTSSCESSNLVTKTTLTTTNIMQVGIMQ